MEILKNELKNLYEKEKLTTYEIAEIYNCCQATVWKRLKQFGIQSRPAGTARVNLPKSKLEKLYLKKKLSTWEIEKRYGYPRGTVYRKLCEYKIKRRTRAEAHIVYPRKDFGGSTVDKAYFIGFAIGDLRLRKRYQNSETISVDCGSTKKEQIKLISKLFKPYGRVWISRPNKRGATRVECLLNKSFIFLLKKRNLIDAWILENKKYFWAFLAGFIDAEGCIAISNKGSAYFSLGNYNKKILNQIRHRLLKEKMLCPPLYLSKIQGKRCFGKYLYNQNYWQLRMHRKNSLLLLFNLIAPYLKHRNKQRDLKRAKQNIILRNRLFGNIKQNL